MINHKGYIEPEDLKLIVLCARACRHDWQYYDVRESKVVHVRKDSGRYEYWSPLDPTRVDVLDLLTRVDMTLDTCSMEPGELASDLRVRVRAGALNRRKTLAEENVFRQGIISGHVFCRTVVTAVAAYQNKLDQALKLKCPDA